MPDGIDPQYLVQWLGHNTGVTPDWAHNHLKPHASHCTQDVHFSHTAQEAHENLIKRSRKTILVTTEAPHASTSAMEQGSTASTLSGSLAAQLSTTTPTTSGGLATWVSAAPAATMTSPPAHDTVMDTAPQEAPTVPPGATSAPMEVDKTPAPPSGQDVRTDMSQYTSTKCPDMCDSHISALRLHLGFVLWGRV